MAATVSRSPPPDSQLAPWTRTLARLDAIHSTAMRREQMRRAHQRRTATTTQSPATSPPLHSKSSSSSSSSGSSPGLCRRPSSTGELAAKAALPPIPKLLRTQSTGIPSPWVGGCSSSSSSASSTTSSGFNSTSSSFSSTHSASTTSSAVRLPRNRISKPAPPPARTDPLSRLPLSIITDALIPLVEPTDVIALQRVSKNWRMVLASEHVYTVALLAHFAGTDEAERVKRRHEGGERFPEISVGGYRRCCRKMVREEKEY